MCQKFLTGILLSHGCAQILWLDLILRVFHGPRRQLILGLTFHAMFYILLVITTSELVHLWTCVAAYSYTVFNPFNTGIPDNNLTGYLVKCVNDINIQLMRIISARELTHRNSTDNKRLLFTLMEPTIEYIMKSIFKDASKVCLSFMRHSYFLF